MRKLNLLRSLSVTLSVLGSDERFNFKRGSLIVFLTWPHLHAIACIDIFNCLWMQLNRKSLSIDGPHLWRNHI